MKHLTVLLALLAAYPLIAPATAPPLLPARVEHAINARIADGEYSAMVVAVVDGGRSHVYALGKLADGKAPDADTVFQIGSITKTFTATLLAEALNRGKVKLDSPVANLMPGFTIPSHVGKPITLGELAMQDSGLPDSPTNLHPADMADPYAGYGAAKLKAFLAGYKLTRDPGAKYEYSNVGVGLLGYALARHAATTYADLVQARILKPLGMTSTSTSFKLPLGPDWAMGHDAHGKPAQPWHLAALTGAGGINSTGADMLRYLEANMGRSHGALQQAMHFAHQPRRPIPIGEGERIGLVWMTRHDKDGDVIWHNGETGGYASFMGFTRDGQRGVVILTNTKILVDGLGFATLLADAPLAPATKAIATTPRQLDTYAGQYQLAPDSILSVYRNGDQLLAQATGQGAFPIYPSAEDAFFARVADIHIVFKRGKDGGVESLVLHQDGHATPAPKLKASNVGQASGHRPVHLDEATLRQYVGHYQLAPNAVLDVTLHASQLMVQLTGQPAFPVYPSARDQFYLTAVDAQLSFERGKDGKVDAVVLHQNGANQRAARLP